MRTRKAPCSARPRSRCLEWSDGLSWKNSLCHTSSWSESTPCHVQHSCSNVSIIGTHPCKLFRVAESCHLRVSLTDSAACRLVDGDSLDTWRPHAAARAHAAGFELQCKRIGVQLLHVSTQVQMCLHCMLHLAWLQCSTCSAMQTLQQMHVVADVAHLDISSRNIMMRKDNPDKWDEIRLLDFGLAGELTGGKLCIPVHSNCLLQSGLYA